MVSFFLEARGPFTLAHSTRFLCGFTPAQGSNCALDDGLRLALLREDDFTPAVLSVTPAPGGVRVTHAGADALRAQAARILSLDHDATGLAEVAARDRVVGALLEREPGFRPVCFPSPYESALWGVLAQRTPMRVAAGMKRRLARATGGSVELGGATFDASPTPRGLLSLTHFEGLPAEKLERLQGLARAALEGHLAAERLRALEPLEALAYLRSLRGVGAWTAELILVRGTGVRDVLSREEPRVLHAVAEAYGLSQLPTPAEVARLAERWRPYRTWLTVRLVSALSAQGWRAGGPRRERRPAPRSAPSTLSLL